MISGGWGGCGWGAYCGHGLKDDCVGLMVFGSSLKPGLAAY